MKISDILYSQGEFPSIDPIKAQCSQFIYESGGNPLYKNLPASYEDIRKVKVRMRKRDKVPEAFNDAFSSKARNLRQRAVFANGKLSLEESKDGEDRFYIFPIDGYRFLYSMTVRNSSTGYKKSFNEIIETFGTKKGSGVIKDLLQFTYVDNEKLVEGIESGVEVIIYNIPYFYAIRESIGSYEEIYLRLSDQ